MELWHQYNEANRNDFKFKERCYVFIVQWILMWGGIDFTPDLRGSILQFIEKSFSDYKNGLAIKHINTLLQSTKVIESSPGEFIEIELKIDHSSYLNEGEKEINSNPLNKISKRKRISRVVTLPLHMMSPRTYNHFNILEFDTQIICDHLTWIESDLFQSIRITELLHNNWLRDNKKIVAPNLTNLSDHFNKVSSWTSSLIITADSVKMQIRLFNKFLRIVKVKIISFILL